MEFEPMSNEERLREALEQFGDAQNWFDTSDEAGGPWPAWRGKGEPEDIAAAALASTEPAPEQEAGEVDDWPTILKVHSDGDKVEGERVPIPSTTEGEREYVPDRVEVCEAIRWEIKRLRANVDPRTEDPAGLYATILALLAQPQEQEAGEVEGFVEVLDIGGGAALECESSTTKGEPAND